MIIFYLYNFISFQYSYSHPSICSDDIINKLLIGGFLNNLHELVVTNYYSSTMELFQRYLPTNGVPKLTITGYSTYIHFRK